MTRRLTVGVITPHAAPGPELEIPALSRGRVTTVLVRAGSPSQLRASTERGAVAEAAATFRAAEVDAVAHASTTTGYVIRAEDEAVLVAELARLCGVPAVASCSAAVTALRAEGVLRVQLVHPPWFDRDFDEMGVAYFGGQGFDAVATRAEELPVDPALVEPHQVVDWVERHLEDGVDGVYLASSGFRTADALDELRRRTGKIVVSADDALLRAVTSLSG